ncbi:MAG TPA: hypothetical protein VLC49_01180 [Solirubrobacteraceae bacterium]|nr:hypothetical protein [Solirubrobacteraceae bacterium]
MKERIRTVDFILSKEQIGLRELARFRGRRGTDVEIDAAPVCDYRFIEYPVGKAMRDR